jgi:hypothetical protein
VWLSDSLTSTFSGEKVGSRVTSLRLGGQGGCSAEFSDCCASSRSHRTSHSARRSWVRRAVLQAIANLRLVNLQIVVGGAWIYAAAEAVEEPTGLRGARKADSIRHRS